MLPQVFAIVLDRRSIFTGKISNGSVSISRTWGDGLIRTWPEVIHAVPSEREGSSLESHCSLPRHQAMLHLMATWPHLWISGEGIYTCKVEHAPLSNSQKWSFTFEPFPTQMLFYLNMTPLCAQIPKGKSWYIPMVQVLQFEHHYKTYKESNTKLVSQSMLFGCWS